MAFGLFGRAPGFAAFDVPQRRLQLGIVGGRPVRQCRGAEWAPSPRAVSRSDFVPRL